MLVHAEELVGAYVKCNAGRLEIRVLSDWIGALFSYIVSLASSSTTTISLCETLYND